MRQFPLSARNHLASTGSQLPGAFCLGHRPHGGVLTQFGAKIFVET